jgi:photosystem II stability/assembly factor-like uncharacterized protein
MTASASGAIMAAVDDKYVLKSSNSGENWGIQGNAGQRPWAAISMSSDGKIWAVAAADGIIYTSTDEGSSWTQRPNSGSRKWASVAVAPDATRIVAVAEGERNVFFCE